VLQQSDFGQYIATVINLAVVDLKGSLPARQDWRERIRF